MGVLDGLCLLAIVVVAGVAAWTDLREERIPNRLTIPAFTAGILVHALAGGLHGLLASLGATLVASMAFLFSLLVKRGSFGYGDVKLVMALGALSGSVDMAGDSLFWLIFCTAGLALVAGWRDLVSWLRDWARFPWRREPVVPLMQRVRGKAVRYAPAISGAWVLTAIIYALSWR